MGKADWELNGLDRILSLSYLISRIGPIAIIRPMNSKQRAEKLRPQTSLFVRPPSTSCVMHMHCLTPIHP